MITGNVLVYIARSILEITLGVDNRPSLVFDDDHSVARGDVILTSSSIIFTHTSWWKKENEATSLAESKSKSWETSKILFKGFETFFLQRKKYLLLSPGTFVTDLSTWRIHKLVRDGFTFPFSMKRSMEDWQSATSDYGLHLRNEWELSLFC